MLHHERDQFVMVDVIKELLYIDIYYPLKAVVHVFQYFLYRHLTTSVRAKAIAVLTKQRLIDRCQHLRDGLLDKSIHHRRDPQTPCPTAFFWYFYPSHRAWLVLPAPDLFFDFIAVFLQVVLEFGIFHTIHSLGPLVSHDLLICPAQIFFAEHILQQTFLSFHVRHLHFFAIQHADFHFPPFLFTRDPSLLIVLDFACQNQMPF